jgi:membrane protease YdiL (CAAX protease family)
VTVAWVRLPVVVRAVLTGLVVATAGTVPWAMLVSANIKHQSALPWAVPIMAGYLWLFWRYVRGAWWPRSTSAARRTNARANSLTPDLWGLALLAGVLGLVSVLLLQGVLGRLVALPPQQGPNISQYRAMTVLLWVLMSAIVAGVVEETAFRGYMQRPIERRHGPVIAILVTGTLFGLLHFTHAEVTLVLLPYYIAAAAVYGALAHLTDSTLPSMVLHAGGNVFSVFDLFTRGRSEWKLTAGPTPLIWESGPDAAFFASAAALLVVGTAAVWAYSELSRAARAARTPERDDRDAESQMDRSGRRAT